MEEALFVEKERAQVTLNCIGDAVVCTDISGNITFLNVVAEKHDGLVAAGGGRPAHGRSPANHGRHEATKRSRIRWRWQLSKTESCTCRRTSILIRRDGFEIPIEDSVAPIHDREGQAAGAVIVFRDVSAARAMALQMAHSAEHDFLTGLPNRMLLNDRIGQAIALAPRHRKQGRGAVSGSGWLQAHQRFARPSDRRQASSIRRKRLVDCVRGSDTVSRQGGDEFVVLLSEVQQAGRRRRDGEKNAAGGGGGPSSIDQHDLHVTASIGVSVYPDDGLDAETLIKNADTAMYQAKENGRQGYQFFKPAMNVTSRGAPIHRGGSAARPGTAGIRAALPAEDRSEDGSDHRRRSLDPLDASRRADSVSPAQFIPVAEDCGLILPIGAWVLREACRQARAWVDAGLPAMTMAVNVSAMEFRNENFLEDVFAILERDRPRSEIARAGADRKRADEARRVDGVDPASLSGKRGAGGGRRFRHGLFELELSAKVPGRCAQDRPVVRPPDQHAPATMRPL